MSDPILAHVEGAVLTLTFNRIEKKNAITTAMYSALADALTDQTNGVPGRLMGMMSGQPFPWGLGPDLHGAKQPHFAPPEASAGSFGHAGASGSLVWVDPAAGVAWAVLGPALQNLAELQSLVDDPARARTLQTLRTWTRNEGERLAPDFARHLIDFDLAANNGGWQWAASSGCDAQPVETGRCGDTVQEIEIRLPRRGVGPDLAGVSRYSVSRRHGADRVYRTTAQSAGALTLVLMGLIGLFLLVKSWDALRVSGLSFLTTAQWEPNGGVFGIAAVLLGTVLISFVE